MRGVRQGCGGPILLWATRLLCPQGYTSTHTPRRSHTHTTTAAVELGLSTPLDLASSGWCSRAEGSWRGRGWLGERLLRRGKFPGSFSVRRAQGKHSKCTFMAVGGKGAPGARAATERRLKGGKDGLKGTPTHARTHTRTHWPCMESAGIWEEPLPAVVGAVQPVYTEYAITMQVYCRAGVVAAGRAEPPCRCDGTGTRDPLP